jgi:hypothetical protein
MGLALPLVADQVARYLVGLSMVGEFRQIPAHFDSAEGATFVAPTGGTGVAVPFGLQTKGTLFEGDIFGAPGDLAYSCMVVCLDDALIVADSVGRALEGLHTVFDALVETGFSLNFSKCLFLKASVLCLGYVMHGGEVRPNADRVRPLSSLPAPASVTRQFVGLASCFREFIPRFSRVVKPLYALTSGSRGIAWTDRHEKKVRRRVVSALTDAPGLMVFDPNYPMELHSDAGSDGCGAVLMHRVEGKNRVVEYYSKRTSPAESIHTN